MVSSTFWIWSCWLLTIEKPAQCFGSKNTYRNRGARNCAPLSLEYDMKSIYAVPLLIVLSFALVGNVSAQTSESIWLTSSTTPYKTGETVMVALNASSATPIQGFTFQIRYDPACLRPVNASSPIPGMNG